MTKDISNKTLATLLVVAIAVSIMGAFLASKPVYITGMTASGTGQVNVSITGLAAITVSQDITFGEGYVNESMGSALLTSNGTVTNGTWAATNEEILIENTGNVDVNVTFNASSDASSWIGTSALAYMAGQVEDVGACGTLNTTWQTLGTGAPATICTTLKWDVDTDTIGAIAKLIIPEALESDGVQDTVTVTFYGSE